MISKDLLLDHKDPRVWQKAKKVSLEHKIPYLLFELSIKYLFCIKCVNLLIII